MIERVTVDYVTHLLRGQELTGTEGNGVGFPGYL